MVFSRDIYPCAGALIKHIATGIEDVPFIRADNAENELEEFLSGTIGLKSDLS